MRKHRIITALWDITYIVLIRVKLIRKAKATVVLLILTLLFSAACIQSLSVAAPDMSSLPVGILDLDQSKSSNALLLRLKAVETLRIVEGSDKELQKNLYDERIIALFIIEEGYEEAIRSGDIGEIITMRYKKENKVASILSDVVAGEMIYPISYYKTLRYYKQLSFEGTKFNEAQFEEYMDNLLGESSDFDFAFRLQYANPNQPASATTISNTVLYNQLIFGILGIFVSFIGMFVISVIIRDKENGTELRLRITKFTRIKQDISIIITLITIQSMLSLLLSWLVYLRLDLQDQKLWFSIFILLFQNALAMGLILLLLAKGMKQLHIYQLFSTAVIMLTGGAGFYQLLSGFYPVSLDKLIKIIPNGWLIQGFTDIIVYGSEGGYSKEGHRVLLFMLCWLIFLVLLIDLVQGFHIEKIQWKKEQDGKTI